MNHPIILVPDENIVGNLNLDNSKSFFVDGKMTLIDKN